VQDFLKEDVDVSGLPSPAPRKVVPAKRRSKPKRSKPKAGKSASESGAANLAVGTRLNLRKFFAGRLGKKLRKNHREFLSIWRQLRPKLVEASWLNISATRQRRLLKKARQLQIGMDVVREKVLSVSRESKINRATLNKLLGEQITEKQTRLALTFPLNRPFFIADTVFGGLGVIASATLFALLIPRFRIVGTMVFVLLVLVFVGSALMITSSALGITGFDLGSVGEGVFFIAGRLKLVAFSAALVFFAFSLTEVVLLFSIYPLFLKTNCRLWSTPSPPD
jgi:hypothetical protein